MINTQTEQENIARVRRGFEAFSAGDSNTLADLFAPNVIWHQAPTGILAGEYRGRDKVLDFFQLIQRETGGTFKVLPRTFAASGDKVLVEQHITLTRKGQKSENDNVQMFTLSDGKIVDVVVYHGDYPSMLNAWR